MKLRFFLIPFFLIFILSEAKAFTLTIQTYSPYYNGYYWAYPNLYSLLSGDSWSIGVYTDSYSADQPLGLTSPLTFYWGDGTYNDFNIYTGLFTSLKDYTGNYSVNGISYANFNKCSNNFYVPDGNGRPKTWFATWITSSGACRIQFNHAPALGSYSVHATAASETAGSYPSNTLNFIVINNPTVGTPTFGVNQMDAGHSTTVSVTFDYGSGTKTADYAIYTGSTSLYSGTLASSPFSASTSTGALSTSTAYYGKAYNPISATWVTGPSATITVFPAITISSLAVSQSPSSVSGSLIAGQPLNLTITIPQQVANGQTEGAPSSTTINWGDGTSTTSATYSASNGNWVAIVPHTYSSSGSYTITVNVVSALGTTWGSSASSTKAIQIQPYVAPSVAITLPSGNACSSSTLYNGFSATYTFSLTTGSYTITQLIVNWGDGTSTTINSPSSTVSLSHTYASSGSYTLTATAYDTVGQSSSSSKYVSISQYQTPSISLSPQSATATQPATFTASVTQGSCPLNTISWNWGDGSSTSGTAVSGTNTASHTYQMKSKSGTGTKTDTYTLGLTVTDNQGKSSSASTTISVSYTYPSISNFNPTNAYNSPSGSTYQATFYATTISGTNPVSTLVVNWGDGTVSSTYSTSGGVVQIAHAFASAGSPTLTLTLSDSAGYYTTLTQLVNIYAYPLPNVIFSGIPSPVYQGIQSYYNITVSPTSGQSSPAYFDVSSISVYWGDGSSSNVPVPVGTNGYGNYSIPHTYSNSGTFTFQITVTDKNNAKNSNSTTITVSPYQAMQFSNFYVVNANNTNPANSTIANIPSTYFITVANGSVAVQNVTFDWGDGTKSYITSGLPPLPNGTTSVVLNLSHTYTSAGNYTLNIIGTDANNLQTSYSAVIQVLPYTKPIIVSFAPNITILSKATNFDVNVQAGSFPIANVSILFVDTPQQPAFVYAPPAISPSGGALQIPYTYSSNGTLPVNITTYDILGNYSSKIYYVYVQTLPNITALYPITYNGNLYNRINTTIIVNITPGSNPLANITIDFGDGVSNTTSLNSTTSNVSIAFNHIYQQSGAYGVVATVYDANANSVQATQVISIKDYKAPEVINITPKAVYALATNNFTFTIQLGSFPLKAMEITWGDGSPKDLVFLNGNETSINVSHSYPYVAQPTVYTITAVVGDINNQATAFGSNVTVSYQKPVINNISFALPATPTTALNPNQTIAQVNTSFTINYTAGTFPISYFIINWGDFTPPQVYNTSVPIWHIYTSPGSYSIKITARDMYNVDSDAFYYSIEALPYIPPKVSQLSPTGGNAGLPINYSVIATPGSFAVSNLTIDWRDGNVVTYPIANGTNTIIYTYLANGTFIVQEAIRDILNFTSTNFTTITMSAVEFSIDLPTEMNLFITKENLTNCTDLNGINYTIGSRCSFPINIAFLGNATTPVNLSISSQSFAIAQNSSITTGNFICYFELLQPSETSSGNQGRLSINCQPNPVSLSYAPQTLDLLVIARSTAGIIKTKMLRLDISTEQVPPSIPPLFNPNQTVAVPNILEPYLPIPAIELTLIIIALFVASWLIFKIFL